MSYIFTMPLKPMKAIARMPAEMRAMGMPFIEAGSSVRESCSRIPAKTTRASVKPIAMEIALDDTLQQRVFLLDDEDSDPRGRSSSS